MMQALVLSVLLTGQAEENKFYGASNLLKNEWAFQTRGTDWYIKFKPENDEVTKGLVWFLSGSDEVFFGNYVIYGDKLSEDILLLQVNVWRRFYRSDGAWSLDTRFRESTARFELFLNEGRKVPEQEIEAVATSVVGRFIEEGATFVLKKEDVDIDHTLPPGFVTKEMQPYVDRMPDIEGFYDNMVILILKGETFIRFWEDGKYWMINNEDAWKGTYKKQSFSNTDVVTFYPSRRYYTDRGEWKMDTSLDKCAMVINFPKASDKKYDSSCFHSKTVYVDAEGKTTKRYHEQSLGDVLLGRNKLERLVYDLPSPGNVYDIGVCSKEDLDGVVKSLPPGCRLK